MKARFKNEDLQMIRVESLSDHNADTYLPKMQAYGIEFFKCKSDSAVVAIMKDMLSPEGFLLGTAKLSVSYSLLANERFFW